MPPLKAVYLNPVTVEAEITQFTPLLDMVADLIPGPVGNSIVGLLNGLAADSELIESVCAGINLVTGATAPPTVSK
jgi:hypothetical protein